ncbi:GNAT family N-acetyltransferase [Vagococcus zengguangii]|uniref:GNAT family N-acetyltransferase n=1 Tax=Vagococcus zengguangii TaxID=2571750 RepID=UPI001107DBCC|nr:GNAT family N-acetyltransferase [Vagococcus zengguangii]TLG80235.1 GNAT family N-acetyltransferase [Vagococcus zengguangii]
MNKREINRLTPQQLRPIHYELLLDADPNTALVQGYVAKGLILELTIENQLVGIMILSPMSTKDKSSLEIKNISILADFQHQGHGTFLLNYAINYANNKNYQALYIGTGTTSFSQLALYQTHGFRFDEIKKDFFCAYPEPIIENNLRLYDMILLKKEL